MHSTKWHCLSQQQQQQQQRHQQQQQEQKQEQPRLTTRRLPENIDEGTVQNRSLQTTAIY
jgi:hypothetical protein